MKFLNYLIENQKKHEIIDWTNKSIDQIIVELKKQYQPWASSIKQLEQIKIRIFNSDMESHDKKILSNKIEHDFIHINPSLYQKLLFKTPEEHKQFNKENIKDAMRVKLSFEKKKTLEHEKLSKMSDDEIVLSIAEKLIYLHKTSLKNDSDVDDSDVFDEISKLKTINNNNLSLKGKNIYKKIKLLKQQFKSDLDRNEVDDIFNNFIKDIKKLKKNG